MFLDLVLIGAAIAMLQRHGVEWNALTTMHAANQDRGREIHLFLRDQCGARFMQFIPIVERATEEIVHLANAGWGGSVRNRRTPSAAAASHVRAARARNEIMPRRRRQLPRPQARIPGR